MKNKKLGLLTITAGALTQGVAQADNTVSLHYLDYQEGDERINVGDTSLGLKLDLGVDYTLNLSLGYDVVSGASPAWQVNDANANADYDRLMLSNAQTKTDHILLGYANDLGRYAIKRVALVDTRKSLVSSLTIRDDFRNELTLGLSHSKENDYESNSISASYLVYLDKYKNRSVSFGGAYLDDKTLVFSDGYLNDRTEDKLRFINLEAGLTQVLSPSATVDVKLFYNHDSGFLSNHYLTILRGVDTNNDEKIDTNEYFLAADARPESRQAWGTKVSSSWQVKPWLTSQASYRFYSDDWDITSHQVKGSIALEPINGWFITPEVVFYSQSKAAFYRNPNSENYTFSQAGFGSNDVRLGEYTATTYVLSSAYQLTNDWQIDIAATYYSQSNKFSATWLVAGVNYKF